MSLKILSETGHIAYKIWYDLPKHFAFVSIDEFVVMPNHIHGIVIIESTTIVGTLHATSLQPQQSTTAVRTLGGPFQRSGKSEFMSTISPKTGSLPTVIRSYKSAVSKNVHLTDRGFSWQPRYYDHLIRSDTEMDRIRKYIINNPVKWDDQ
jgi:putative transposase